jgi:hypothetical protein
MMYKLALQPDQDNYQATDGPKQVYSRLDGGLGKLRADYVNGVYMVEVQWTVGPGDFQYLQTFYSVTNRGVDAFLIDLILTSFELREYTARIVPGTWRLAAIRGEATTIKARLEVVPDPPDTELDEGLVVTYESFGDEGATAYDLLRVLVNVTMPEHM